MQCNATLLHGDGKVWHGAREVWHSAGEVWHSTRGLQEPQVDKSIGTGVFELVELGEVTFGGSIQFLEMLISPGACKRGLLRILRLDTGSLGNDMDLTGNLEGGRKTHNLILVGGGEDL